MGETRFIRQEGCSHRHQRAHTALSFLRGGKVSHAVRQQINARCLPQATQPQVHPLGCTLEGLGLTWLVPDLQWYESHWGGSRGASKAYLFTKSS